jgi:ABC-type glycerol-3-phosphate transport system substrate-binding protein
MKYIIISTIFIALIVSCNSTEEKYSGDNAKDTLKGKEIKWYCQWYGHGLKEKLMYEIAREFSLINQNYNLKIEFSHQINNFPPDESTWLPNIDTISKMVASNEWPFDIMLCDIYLYNAVSQRVGDPNWAEKYLMDFRNEKWFQDSHKDVIYKTDEYTKQYGGIAPGAYLESFWELLYVSELSEKKLGIKVNRTNMTMDDFISYAKAVYEYNQKNNDKITCLWEQRGEEGYNNILTFWIISWLEKEKADSQQEAFEVLNEIYKKLEEVSKYLPVEQYHKAKDEWDLKTDKILFTYHSNWVNNMWQKRYPEMYKQMHVCELPTPKDKVAPAYLGNYNPIFVIPKAAKNKEGALKLMKLISSADVAQRWIKCTNSETGLKSQIQYTDFDKSETSIFAHYIESKYKNVLKSYNLSKVLFGENSNINFHASQIWRGEMTADEALNSVKKQVKDQI